MAITWRATGLIGDNTGGEETHTLASVDFGTAAADRHVYVGFSPAAFDATGVTSVLIGGVTADPDPNNPAAITGSVTEGFFYVANVPTGTSGDVVISYSGGGVYNSKIVVWTDNGEPTFNAAVQDTTIATDELSLSIGVPADGKLLAFALRPNMTSASWTAGATESADVDANDITAANAEGLSAEGSRTVTVVFTGGFGFETLLRATTFSTGGGAIAVDVPATSYSTTGPNPTINQTTPVSVPATTYAVAAPAPSIGVAIPVAVPATSYSVIAPAPGIAAQETITVPATSYSTTAPAPGITEQVSVSVPVSSVELSAPAPTISVGAAVSVPATTYSVTTPSASITESVGVSVPATAYTTSAPEPTIDTGGATLIADAITIASRSNTLMAPESITFRVDPDTLTTPLGIAAPTGAYDARLSEPTFVWTFGDSYQFTSSVNTEQFNSGTALGAAAQHTYRQAGTYTVRLDIYTWDGGHWYSETTVTVNAFSGTTITVGPSGRDYTALDDAISAMLGSESGVTRIVLDRGQTYSCSGTDFGVTTSDRWPSFQIVAADGAGAKPIVNLTKSFRWWEWETLAAAGSKDAVFQNIDFQGGFSASTNTGPDVSFIEMINPTVAPGIMLFDGCVAQGFRWMLNISRDAEMQTRVILNDTRLYDYLNAAVYCFRLALLASTGSAILGHPEARINDGDVNFQGGPPWRTDAAIEILNKSDGFSRQGWSGTSHPTRLAYQAFRMNADGRQNTETYVSENIIESGYRIFTFGAEQSGNPATNVPRPHRALQFESNICVANWQNNQMIYSRVGGAHYRNNLFIWPASVDNDGVVAPVINQVNSNGEANGEAENLNSPIYAHNNTIVNLRTSGSADMLQHDTSAGTFTSITIANNIIHEPNKGVPVVTYAPLKDDGAVLMTPRELGYRAADGTWAPEDQASPATTAYTFAPESGSIAIAGATGSVIAPLDRTNTLRPSPASIGASELSTTGVSVTVPGTTYTVGTPTVTLGVDTDVVVPATSYALIGPNPTIVEGVGVLVPATSYAVSAPAPAIPLSVAIGVPSTGYALAALEPTIVQGVGVTVPATSYALSALAQQIDLNILVSVPESSLELFAPEVEIGVGVPVSVPATSYSLTFPAPAVDAPEGVIVPVTTYEIATPDITLLVPDVDVELVGFSVAASVGALNSLQLWTEVEPEDDTPSTIWTRTLP